MLISFIEIKISSLQGLSRMAGKDAKVESKSTDVVRQGFMVKRSQNKKRFTPVNYKQRWFVLTRRHLVYYDSDGEVSTKYSIGKNCICLYCLV